MKGKYSLTDQYLVDDDDYNPVAASKDYEYKPHEVSIQEAKQWREMFISLYTEDRARYMNILCGRAVKALHCTNLIMFCGVKPSEIFRVRKERVDKLLEFKNWYGLDEGDYVFFIDTALYKPLEVLAKMLSTMKGWQQIRPCNIHTGMHELCFHFECEDEIGDNNEDSEI